MYAAACSCRVGTKRTVERDSDSLRSTVSSPGTPNTYGTPSASRQETSRSEALRPDMSSRVYGAAPRTRPWHTPTRDPAPGREPHQAPPRGHAHAHRGERRGVPPVAAFVRHAAGAADLLLLPRRDPVGGLAPGEPRAGWSGGADRARRGSRTRRRSGRTA